MSASLLTLLGAVIGLILVGGAIGWAIAAERNPRRFRLPRSIEQPDNWLNHSSGYESGHHGGDGFGGHVGGN